MFQCNPTLGMRWCYAFVYTFISSKVICKYGDITKKELFLFDLPGKAQNVTLGSQIGYEHLKLLVCLSCETLLQLGGKCAESRVLDLSLCLGGGGPPGAF